ncbi:MAG: hypothetical protein EOP45_06790 [Sphingobacteriaceae bacterium]|nr:MAG: hypothetical protein EOP45_06790 [Sphingobacteriaceae bacterium]
MGKRVVELIQANPNTDILLTAFTHSAVDNMISAVVSALSLANLSTKVNDPLRLHVNNPNKDLHLWNSANIVASTTLGLTHPYFTWRKAMFDYAIVDEASQMLEPICYAAIRLARKTILAGDHLQLGPVVKTAGSILQISLFEKNCLSHPQNVTTLHVQYRMNDKIQEVVNEIIYHPRGIALVAANESVANNYLDSEPVVEYIQCDDVANVTKSVTNQSESDNILDIVVKLVGMNFSTALNCTLSLMH